MVKEFNEFYTSSGICTDTRSIQKDALFVCIKGENFDGNSFASSAIEQGAKHVIIDNPDFFTDPDRMTLVDDSISYLHKLANYHRKKFNIPVLGITGSNGKTTNKELIIAILEQKFNVLGTIGNLNNHLGVPFTLLRLNETQDIAVIEMGANKPGDIAELCEIAEPTHGLITNIGKAHLEGFKDFDGVKFTKRELYESIEKTNGTIFYNAKDQVLLGILPKETTNIAFGSNQDQFQATLLSLTPFVRLSWSYGDYSSPPISTRLVGKYNFTNFEAAIRIGLFFGVEPDKINHAISNYVPTNHRSQVETTESNTIIMDCYNANPTSMQSALESFIEMTNPQKLVILGDMLELGAESIVEHQKIVDYLQENSLDALLVGNEFCKVAGKITCFKDQDELRDFLSTNKVEQKLILLKGSRGIKLEKVLDQL